MHSSKFFCSSFERAVYPHLLLFPKVDIQFLRFLFLSRGLDPQGPHPKIRETSPIVANEAESKFGSFVRSARDSDVTVDNTHSTFGCFRREVDTLGFQSYQRVLAPQWIYPPAGPAEERYSDLIEPKVAVYGFVDRREEVDARNLQSWVESREARQIPHTRRPSLFTKF